MHNAILLFQVDENVIVEMKEEDISVLGIKCFGNIIAFKAFAQSKTHNPEEENLRHQEIHLQQIKDKLETKGK